MPETPVAPAPTSRWSSAKRDHARELFTELAGVPVTDQIHKLIRDELVEMHMPLVEHLARRYRDRGEYHEDLVQVGMVGLINAVDRFDVERGLEFSTFATPTILGEIKRHFRDHAWAVHVPRRLQERNVELNRAIESLIRELSRPPTITELAKYTELTDAEVMEALDAGRAYTAASIDAAADAHAGGESPYNRIGGPDQGLEAFELRESFRLELAVLPERERQIVILRFFKNQSQSQIAEQLGISQMHVSRLLATSLAQIRESMSDN
ncbi:MAG: SigB/SigF/SigG family RNA polymerase sigma factor [Candidatus Nanopelagicales bacterium]|nr:SigB/SigF/SigG family RNA polymerase sigma factor [Candidatus Nanopelagicales bacterium]